MYISKKVRLEVYSKFNGKCAYSGTPLEDDWQVEHLEPKIAFELGWAKGEDPNHIANLLPVQRSINHYKRGLPLEEFRNWFLAGLHERLKKLPKNPKAERSIKRKAYLLNIASYFGIKEEKPFSGTFYFETLN
jgi:hypothetical protein